MINADAIKFSARYLDRINNDYRFVIDDGPAKGIIFTTQGILKVPLGMNEKVDFNGLKIWGETGDKEEKWHLYSINPGGLNAYDIVLEVGYMNTGYEAAFPARCLYPENKGHRFQLRIGAKITYFTADDTLNANPGNDEIVNFKVLCLCSKIIDKETGKKIALVNIDSICPKGLQAHGISIVIG